MKRQLTEVKKQQKVMYQEFIIRLGKTRAELTAVQERDLVLRLTRSDLTTHLASYVTAHSLQIITALEDWWDKYAFPLHQIEADRETAITRMATFLKELGYE